jgi:RNase H-fold protein (predicted Holliday junction resolvase)
MYLALDWGLKKVGVATADPQGIVVTPRPTLLRPKSPQLWSLTADDKSNLLKLKASFESECIVLGNPLRAGKSRPQELQAYANFCRKLSEILGLPVETETEELSSWEAGQSADSPHSEDSLAAALILKSFLARRLVGTPPRP